MQENAATRQDRHERDMTGKDQDQASCQDEDKVQTQDEDEDTYQDGEEMKTKTKTKTKINTSTKIPRQDNKTNPPIYINARQIPRQHKGKYT
jgi:hypothetical protein